MKRFALVAACFPLSVAAEQTRSLDAHEHGTGTLGIAVSGSEIAISLEAPGADIVSFEHSAESAEDRAAVETAISDLESPLDLFVLPKSAGCAVTATAVSLLGDHQEEDDHADHAVEHSDDDHGHEDEHAHEDHGHDDEEHAEGHTEFRSEYVLTCADPQSIDQIKFAFFERFPNALELDVQIVTDNGASAHEVERDAPVLDLKGMF